MNTRQRESLSSPESVEIPTVSYRPSGFIDSIRSRLGGMFTRKHQRPHPRTLQMETLGKREMMTCDDILDDVEREECIEALEENTPTEAEPTEDETVHPEEDTLDPDAVDSVIEDILHDDDEHTVDDPLADALHALVDGEVARQWSRHRSHRTVEEESTDELNCDNAEQIIPTPQLRLTNHNGELMVVGSHLSETVRVDLMSLGGDRVMTTQTLEPRKEVRSSIPLPPTGSKSMHARFVRVGDETVIGETINVRTQQGRLTSIANEEFQEFDELVTLSDEQMEQRWQSYDTLLADGTERSIDDVHDLFCSIQEEILYFERTVDHRTQDRDATQGSIDTEEGRMVSIGEEIDRTHREERLLRGVAPKIQFRSKVLQNRSRITVEDMPSGIQAVILEGRSVRGRTDLPEGSYTMQLSIVPNIGNFRLALIQADTGEEVGPSVQFRTFRGTIREGGNTSLESVPELARTEELTDEEEVELGSILQERAGLESQQLETQGRLDGLREDLLDDEAALSLAEERLKEALRESVSYPRLIVTSVDTNNLNNGNRSVGMKIRTKDDVIRIRVIRARGHEIHGSRQVVKDVTAERDGGWIDASYGLTFGNRDLGPQAEPAHFIVELLDTEGNVVDGAKFHSSGRIDTESDWEDLDSGMLLPETERIEPDISIMKTDGVNVLFAADSPMDSSKVRIQGDGILSNMDFEHEGGDRDNIGIVTFNGVHPMNIPGIYNLQLLSKDRDYVMKEIPLEWTGSELRVVNQSDMWTEKRVARLQEEVGPESVLTVGDVIRNEMMRQAREELEAMDAVSRFNKAMLVETLHVDDAAVREDQGWQLYSSSRFYQTQGDFNEAFYGRFPNYHPDRIWDHIQEERDSNPSWSPNVISSNILSARDEYRGIMMANTGHYYDAMKAVMIAAVEMYVNIRNGMDGGEAFRNLEHAIDRENNRYVRELGAYAIGIPSAEELREEGLKLYKEMIERVYEWQALDDRIQAERQQDEIDEWEEWKRQRDWELENVIRRSASMTLTDYHLANPSSEEADTRLATSIARRLRDSQDPRFQGWLTQTESGQRVADAIDANNIVGNQDIAVLVEHISQALDNSRGAQTEEEIIEIVEVGVFAGIAELDPNMEGILHGSAPNYYPIRPDIDGDTGSVTVEMPEEGSAIAFFTITEEKMVNLWIDGNDLHRNASLTLEGGDLSAPLVSSHENVSGESISVRLSPGTYTLRITDIGSAARLSSLTTDTVSIPVHYALEDFRSQEIIGRMSIPESDEVLPVRMRVAEFTDGRRKLDYDAPIEEGGVSTLNPHDPVWVVVHGKSSSERAEIMNQLARSLHGYADAKGFQVVTIDWEEAAQHGIGLQNARWAPAVGQWIAQQLTAAGFDGSQINIAGWSHGSYIAYETARAMGGEVNSIVALDAATNIPTQSGYDSSDINFADVTRHSIAIDSSIIAGSDSLAATADTAFQVQTIDTLHPYTRHKLAVTAFANILEKERNAPGGFSDHFSLDRIMGTEEYIVDYDINEYDDTFEGIISVTVDGVQANPQTLRYWDDSDNTEKTVQFSSIHV